jgi:AcrR family transcriptional regulator
MGQRRKPKTTRKRTRKASGVRSARKSVARAKRKSTSAARSPGETEAKSAVSDRRRLKGIVSRERILESALDLFSQRGYAATGVYDIARAAGIEKTALYWHFGSKEGLLAAVLDQMDAEFVDRVAKRVAQRGGDTDDRLDLFVNGLKRLVTERGHLIRLTLSVSIERSQVSAETRAAMERIFERTRVAVAAGFAQALGVQLPDVDLIARLTLAYLFEAAVRAQIDPDGVEHDRFFAHLRRLIALDVEHQLAGMRAAVEPARMPARK